MTDWTCPRCGQQFTRRNQSHSCDRRAVEELFAGYPKALKVTQLVKAHLDRLGPVQMAAAKTQVSFRSRIRFAWVWTPRQSVGRGSTDPRVSFGLRHRLESPRVEAAFTPRAGVWVHHVPVTAPRQVDAELKSWLAEAHETVGPGAEA